MKAELYRLQLMIKQKNNVEIVDDLEKKVRSICKGSLLDQSL